jgi:hypothetical protein
MPASALRQEGKMAAGDDRHADYGIIKRINMAFAKNGVCSARRPVNQNAMDEALTAGPTLI